MLDGSSLMQQQGLELAFLNVVEGVKHHGQELWEKSIETYLLLMVGPQGIGVCPLPPEGALPCPPQGGFGETVLPAPGRVEVCLLSLGQGRSFIANSDS